MTLKYTILALALALAPLALALTSPAAASGKITCKVAAADMKPKAELVTALTKQGWKVTKAKPDGGCYEVYGTTPEGDRVEAYFHPVSFEKLYVSQRGKVLFQKQ
jgi:hypothetical protein